MSITLQTHKPFEYTQTLFEKVDAALEADNPTFFILAKRVAEVALLEFALIPAFIADLVLLAAQKVYLFCYPIEQKIAQEGKIPTKTEMNICTPLAVPRFANSQLLFEQAIQEAFSILNQKFGPEIENQYRELIREDGVLLKKEEEEEEAPVEIFQWSAKALLAYFLRISYFHQSYMPLFQDKNPEETQPLPTIQDLRSQYTILSNAEKTSALLTILLKNHTSKEKWQLTERADQLVKDIENISLRMTQNSEFIQNIYSPYKKKLIDHS